MKLLFYKFFEISRLAKRIISVGVDTSFIFFAFFLATYLRLGSLEYVINSLTLKALGITVLLTSVVWAKLGLYRAVIRYIDTKVLANLVVGCIVSSAGLMVASFLFGANLPRSIPLIYFFVLLMLVSSSRLYIRALLTNGNDKQKECVVIYGAGSAGRQLCLSLQHGAEYRSIGFIDDNVELHGSIIAGLKVYSPHMLSQLVEENNIKKVLLAIPSASSSKKKRIIKQVEALNIQMLTIPGSADLVSGQCRVNELRTVAIEDLLCRDPVAPNQTLLEKRISNKSVLVTGAGGSIGSELCRQIALFNPRELVIFELCEFNLYKIERDLNHLYPELRISPVLGSVLDKRLVRKVLKEYDITIVYHAAAYKHVPLVEYNVRSGIYNNVWGTKIVADEAKAARVDYFVLVSTDKAVRPTNFMGASKRLAEVVLQSLACESQHTIFSMVRFGNVLGSSGSVVPLFKTQIEKGGPVTVTHPEITRFFMTIPEAASLVIQAGAMAKGGDVFVLDMGEPVKINDLATNMVHLMGLEVKSEENPEGYIEIVYSGLRPGEKLFEELVIGAKVEGTEHPRIMKANEAFLSASALESLLQQLEIAMDSGDLVSLRELLVNADLGYGPVSPIKDLLWGKQLGQSTFKEQDSLGDVTEKLN